MSLDDEAWLLGSSSSEDEFEIQRAPLSSPRPLLSEILAQECGGFSAAAIAALDEDASELQTALEKMRIDVTETMKGVQDAMTHTPKRWETNPPDSAFPPQIEIEVETVPRPVGEKSLTSCVCHSPELLIPGDAAPPLQGDGPQDATTFGVTSAPLLPNDAEIEETTPTNADNQENEGTSLQHVDPDEEKEEQGEAEAAAAAEEEEEELLPQLAPPSLPIVVVVDVKSPCTEQEEEEAETMLGTARGGGMSTDTNLRPPEGPVTDSLAVESVPLVAAITTTTPAPLNECFNGQDDLQHEVKENRSSTDSPIEPSSSSSSSTRPPPPPPPPPSMMVASTQRLYAKQLLRACCRGGQTQTQQRLGVDNNLTACYSSPAAATRTSRRVQKTTLHAVTTPLLPSTVLSETIQTLVNAGAPLHCRSDGGKTPLHLAIECLGGIERVESVRVLLQAGASAQCQDASGANALHALAASSVAKEAVGEDVRSVGGQAVSGDAVLIAKMLVTATTTTSSGLAALDLFVNARTNRGMTALLIAASTPRRRRCEEGARGQQQPVIYKPAAGGGSGDSSLRLDNDDGVCGLVSFLLEQGSDPWLCESKYGRNALHAATLSGRADVVAHLLLHQDQDKEESDSAPGYGSTGQEDQEHRHQQLLVDSTTLLGCTALHLAAQRNLVSVASLLLRARADVSLRAVGGGSARETAVETAARLRHEKVHNLLKRYSAHTAALKENVSAPVGASAFEKSPSLLPESAAAAVPAPQAAAAAATAAATGRAGPSADKLSDWRSSKSSQLARTALLGTHQATTTAGAMTTTTFFGGDDNSPPSPSPPPLTTTTAGGKAVFVVPPGRDLEPSTSIRMMAKKEKKKNNNKGDGVVVSRQEILRRKTDPLIHRENRRVADRLRATYTRPSSSSSSSIQQGGGSSSSSSSRGLQRRATAAGLVYGESSRRERLEAAAIKAATLDAGHAIGSSGIPKGLGLCVRCVACGMESDQQQQQQQQGVSGSEEEVAGIVVPFRPCPLCERVWYCDETCRGVDWALSHRRQCDGVSSKTKTIPGAPTTALGVHTSYWIDDKRFGEARRLLLMRPKPSETDVLRACEEVRVSEARAARDSRQATQNTLHEPDTAAKLPSKAAQHSMRRLRVEGVPRHAHEQEWRSKVETRVLRQALREEVIPYVADEFDVLTGKVKPSQRHDLERRVSRAQEVVRDVPEERPLVERMWARDMRKNSERRVVFGAEPGRARSVFTDIGDHGVPYDHGGGGDDGGGDGHGGGVYTDGVRKERVKAELPTVLF